MSSFNEIQLRDIRDLQDSIREQISNADSLERAAQACVSRLYEYFRESVVLARLYVTIPYGSLTPSNKAFVRTLAESKNVGGMLTDLTPVLSLLGTRGDKPAWNDRRKSQGHVGIPLLATSFIESVPMIARLLQDLGVGIEWIDKQDIREVDKVLAGGISSLFHVDDAETTKDRLGRLVIPASDFVHGHGIKTVFGTGGGYIGGTLVALILFTRESVPRATAQKLVPVVNVFKAATTAHVLNGRFFAPA